jgi:hypothetical protein
MNEKIDRSIVEGDGNDLEISGLASLIFAAEDTLCLYHNWSQQLHMCSGALDTIL